MASQHTVILVFLPLPVLLALIMVLLQFLLLFAHLPLLHLAHLELEEPLGRGLSLAAQKPHHGLVLRRRPAPLPDADSAGPTVDRVIKRASTEVAYKLQ